MSTNESIALWIKSLQEGEQDAAQRLWDEYFHRLLRFTSTKLPINVRRSFDEEDVALSAFKSFVGGVHGGRFPDLEDPDNLWRVLAVIASRKAQAYLRRENRQKRGGGAVRGDSGVTGGKDDSAEGMEVIPDDQPSPEYQAAFVEECQVMLDKLPKEELRSIALLKMQGHTLQEIAQLMECTKRAVQRRLEIIRRTWREDVMPEETVE